MTRQPWGKLTHPKTYRLKPGNPKWIGARQPLMGKRMKMKKGTSGRIQGASHGLYGSKHGLKGSKHGLKGSKGLQGAKPYTLKRLEL
jgi:hypothetical protein